MSGLATFNILTRKGLKLPVTGAAGNPTRTPRLVHEKAMFSFGLSAPEVGGGMGGAFSQANTLGTDILTAVAYYTTPPVTGSVLALHDQVTLTMPRHFPKLETMLEWWDNAELPGHAHEMTFTGASGSNIITVADISLLTVGQNITAAGNTPIPASTKIAGLYVGPSIEGAAPTFFAGLTKALLADAADVLATLTGSNLVTAIAASDYQWHGVGTPSSVN